MVRTAIALGLLLVFVPTAASAFGFGLTTGPDNPYAGSYYTQDRDAGDCIWRKYWVNDQNGRRVLKRVRICY